MNNKWVISVWVTVKSTSALRNAQVEPRFNNAYMWHLLQDYKPWRFLSLINRRYFDLHFVLSAPIGAQGYIFCLAMTWHEICWHQSFPLNSLTFCFWRQSKKWQSCQYLYNIYSRTLNSSPYKYWVINFCCLLYSNTV